MTETERQLAYIDAQIARGDRDPKDIKVLKERRTELLRRGARRIVEAISTRAPAPAPTPEPDVDAKAIGKAVAKAARQAAEGGEAA